METFLTENKLPNLHSKKSENEAILNNDELHACQMFVILIAEGLV
jgi:hypothetical protein